MRDYGRPGRQWRWPRWALLHILLSLAPHLAAQGQPPEGITLTVTPASPSPLESVQLKAVYSTNCLVDRRVEREGDTLRLIAQERCLCPLGPSFPTTVVQQLPPLPVGQYHFEFGLEARDSNGVCSPLQPLAERPFVVSSSGSILEILTTPEHPRAGDPITLVTRVDQCSDGLLSRGRHGKVITVETFPLETPAGCPPLTEFPVLEEHTVELGPLPAGRYLVPLIEDHFPSAFSAPRLELPFLLTVAPGDRAATDVRPPKIPASFFGIEELRIEPEFRNWQTPLAVEIDTFIDCPGGHRSEVVGEELRITLTRRCDCPPAIPVPITLTGDFDPLPPGSYDIVLLMEEVSGPPVAGLPPCGMEPWVVESHPLLISGQSFALEGRVEPPYPREGEEVVLQLKFRPVTAVFGLSDPEDPGPILEVLGSVPPLDPVPTEEFFQRSLGSRAGGDYFVLVLVEGRDELPQLEAIVPFSVLPKRAQR